MVKRKHTDETVSADTASRKQIKSNGSVDEHFNAGLLSDETAQKYRQSYASSKPYKHAVVQPLMSDDLLRSVRQEIIENIHFSSKETDIYRIEQSGDLANLDGLPEDSLSKLPSLLQLRDALYSPQFRSWISTVSGAGPVSGKKTDMAINVYKPGCHLLCHDDVIGSRRVSYILYLTDPEQPWQEGWGGALRLYPTTLQTSSDGRKLRVPDANWSVSIPPAWNQLSFFAVQPGESFHDVEEVYHRRDNNSADDGGRVRMAISGWFHIPQKGEEGFEEGLEEKLAEQSSLQQLQAKNDTLDLPQFKFEPPRSITSDDADEDDVDERLSTGDLDFLLKYMAAQYLTPDTVEELSELFTEESSLQLSNILSAKIIGDFETQINELEHLDKEDPRWETASPPHKHRYLFRQVEANASSQSSDILGGILNDLLPSKSFHKWLRLVTGLSLGNVSTLARRFRKGLDYTLATAHEDDSMQLEWCLNLSPSKGWADDAAAEQDGEAAAANGHANGESSKAAAERPTMVEEDAAPGGYELYMAGDDADAPDDDASDHGVTLPPNAGQASSSSTGGGHRRVLKSNKAQDPAIYKTSGEDEDDGILFTNPAAWNTMSIVLRDKATLKFVKYVSRNAPGDRWDIVGCAPVEDDDDDDDDEEEDDGVPEEDGDGQEDEDEDEDEDGEEE